MMINTKTATQIGTRALALTMILAFSVAVPVFFHLAGLSGHVFLPIFTVLVIGSFYVSPAALTGTALLIPLINTVVTGMPALEPLPMMPLLTVEMTFTALAASVLRKKKSLTRLFVPLTLGRLMSLPFVLLASDLSLTWWLRHYTAGLPGMALNIALAGTVLFVFPPAGKRRAPETR
jgi:hypothetical protein